MNPGAERPEQVAAVTIFKVKERPQELGMAKESPTLDGQHHLWIFIHAGLPFASFDCLVEFSAKKKVESTHPEI